LLLTIKNEHPLKARYIHESREVNKPPLTKNSLFTDFCSRHFSVRNSDTNDMVW